MSPGDREALEALQRRLCHTAAIAHLIARESDTMMADAIRGVAYLLQDCEATIDRILPPVTS